MSYRGPTRRWFNKNWLSLATVMLGTVWLTLGFTKDAGWLVLGVVFLWLGIRMFVCDVPRTQEDREHEFEQNARIFGPRERR